MILYVDMEHKSGRSTSVGKGLLAARMRIKYRLEDLTDLPCHIVHYSNLTTSFLDMFDFKAILLSGSATDPEHYHDLDGFNQVMRETALPILGLCGGWQFMALAFGAEIQPLGKLRDGDSNKGQSVVFREGYIQEFGFHPVEISESHPLLEGLGSEAVLWHAHYLEVSPVPQGFRVFARTQECAVQFAAHEKLPRFGTQFHPEYYNEEYNAGQTILQNFFKLADVRIKNG